MTGHRGLAITLAFLTWCAAAAALTPTFAAPAFAAAAPAAPEGGGETAKDAIVAFIDDAKAKRVDAVRARLFVPEGPGAKQEVDDLIEVVESGMFEAHEVRVLDVREAGDAAVVVADFRKRGGGRSDIDPLFLLRDGGRWRVLPSPDLAKFETLPDERKKEFAELQEWYVKRKDELRRAPDPAAEVQRKLNTGLALAAAKGDAAEVERLIGAGADVNGEAYALGSPLKAVVDRDKADMIRLLVEKGAKVDPPGESLLFGAIDRGKPETVKLLIELGADVNRAWQRDTPLGLAARLGKSGVVKMLLDAKADPRPARGMGGPMRQTTLLNLAASSGDLATFELVRPLFDDLKLTDESGHNALHAVAQGFPLSAGKDHAAIVERLLAAGVDPHAKARDEERAAHFGVPVDTPLRMAATSARAGVTDALLGRVKYDPAELTFVLPLAVRHHHPPASVRKLLDAGADPNAADKPAGRTALHHAVARSSPAVVELLLAHDADPSAKDAHGADAVALARVRAEKGREGSRPGQYHPEFEEAPDAGAKILRRLTGRAK